AAGFGAAVFVAGGVDGGVWPGAGRSTGAVGVCAKSARPGMTSAATSSASGRREDNCRGIGTFLQKSTRQDRRIARSLSFAGDEKESGVFQPRFRTTPRPLGQVRRRLLRSRW